MPLLPDVAGSHVCPPRCCTLLSTLRATFTAAKKAVAKSAEAAAKVRQELNKVGSNRLVFHFT